MADTGMMAAVRQMMTEPRQVTAILRFRGPAGREDDAARAWAFELEYYFLRGVGEPPLASYENGVYTVTGLIQTTHPGDKPVTDFSGDEPVLLDSVFRAGREAYLRDLYGQRGIRFDGRPHPREEPVTRHG